MDLRKYFNRGSKKREISSETSRSSNDPKKIGDGSLHDSNNPDDASSEGLSSTDCVKILYNCIKSVEKQIQNIQRKIEETKMSQIKGKQHFTELNKTVNFICETLMSLNVAGLRKRLLLMSCRKMLMICLQQQNP